MNEKITAMLDSDTEKYEDLVAEVKKEVIGCDESKIPYYETLLKRTSDVFDALYILKTTIFFKDADWR